MNRLTASPHFKAVEVSKSLRRSFRKVNSRFFANQIVEVLDLSEATTPFSNEARFYNHFILLQEGKNTSLFKTLVQIFSHYQFIDVGELDLLPPTPSIGLLRFCEDTVFKDGFLRLDALGVRPVVVLDEYRRFSGFLAKHRDLLPREIFQELRERCFRSSFDLAEIARQIECAKDSLGCEPLRDSRLTAFLRAERLFDGGVGNFGHNSDLDITNSTLAPARMLLLSNKWPEGASYDKTVRAFDEGVLSCIEANDYLDGQLAKELKDSFGRVKRGLAKRPTPHSERKILIEALNCCMSILTEVRAKSLREVTKAPRKSSGRFVEPLSHRVSPGFDNVFRILVVDDFSDTWRPVLLLVQEELETKGLSCSIEFSVDGQNVMRDIGQVTPLAEALPSYHLVLLDIYLGTADGIEVLDSIRQGFLWLPVLLWTTSVGRELPAQAALANGFIFKKQATVGEIVHLLERWLPEGQARKDVGLTSRFFDTTIRTLAYRRCALEFEKTCLKVLDSFHALDRSYFRLYTDHGGRHIRILLHTLEQLLSPLLLELDDAAPHAMFSRDPEERERELFRLYLAVLCHEVGMFHFDAEHPNPSDNSSQEAIRKTHPVRGAFSILSEAGYQLREIEAVLSGLKQLGKEAEPIRIGVAVLTGYHARLLDLRSAYFLKKIGTVQGRGRRKLASAISQTRDTGINVPDAETVEKRLAGIGEHLDRWYNSTADRYWKQRLQKHCALLRFADALDLDRTRMPLGFLLMDPERDRFNIREHVKREIVEEVLVENSGVTLLFNTRHPSSPHSDNLAHIVGSSELERIREQPWSISNRSGLLELQTRLDRWLELYWWRVLMNKTRSSPTKEQEQEISKLEGEFPEIRSEFLFSVSGREIAGIISALSVAGELLDEYQAIEDCGLEDKIKLDRLEWRESIDWSQLNLLGWNIER